MLVDMYLEDFGGETVLAIVTMTTSSKHSETEPNLCMLRAKTGGFLCFPSPVGFTAILMNERWRQLLVTFRWRLEHVLLPLSVRHLSDMPLFFACALGFLLKTAGNNEFYGLAWCPMLGDHRGPLDLGAGQGYGIAPLSCIAVHARDMQGIHG